MTLVAPPRSARFHLVYEAHPAPAEGIGAFLTVAANGVDALRTLGTDHSAIAAGFPTTAITVWSSAQGPAQATSSVDACRATRFAPIEGLGVRAR